MNACLYSFILSSNASKILSQKWRRLFSLDMTLAAVHATWQGFVVNQAVSIVPPRQLNMPKTLPAVQSILNPKFGFLKTFCFTKKWEIFCLSSKTRRNYYWMYCKCYSANVNQQLILEATISPHLGRMFQIVVSNVFPNFSTLTQANYYCTHIWSVSFGTLGKEKVYMEPACIYEQFSLTQWRPCNLIHP